MIAVDIAEFTAPDRDDDIRLYLHEELYRILEKAFDGSGISWKDCFREDRGDGVLIVMPPGIACKAIIDPLPERLRSLIRRHNHVFSAAARIQLRAAAHIGPVDHDGNGFIGRDIDALFRMLDARLLRHALAVSGAELALIISDYIYRNVVCRYPSLASPHAFQRVRFQVKYTRAQAWTHLPGTPPSSPVSPAGAHADAGQIIHAIPLHQRTLDEPDQIPRPRPPGHLGLLEQPHHRESVTESVPARTGDPERTRRM